MPIVTNIGASVRPRADRTGGLSILSVEASGDLTGALDGGHSVQPLLWLPATETRMPEGRIRIYDGLLNSVNLHRRPGGLELGLDLACPSRIRTRAIPGFPARLELELSRFPLWRALQGRRLLVDPGHGGRDAGGRGPIDLLEKDQTLAVARYLRDQLADLGSNVFLTRAADQTLSDDERLAAAHAAKADAVISLHTGCFTDPAIAGITVHAYNKPGSELAAWIHGAMTVKLPLPDRGLGGGDRTIAFPMPAVVVEFATISNPVEEGWLRSSTFLKRVGGAVVNGLFGYFMNRPGPRERPRSLSMP